MLSHTRKIYGILGLIVSLLWLVACSSPTPTSLPTPDLNPLRTEVAATVLAQVALDLAQTPSATIPPSSTATIAPSLTPTVVESLTPTPTSIITATLATGTVGTALIDRAEWVSQSIPDDTAFTPGETFTMTWTLRNVGTSTWTAGYLLRFYSGDTFGAAREIILGQEVPPGDTVDITIKMRAPTRPGTYQSVWVMSTENRSNFKEPVYLQIEVVTPPTPTRAP